MAAFLLLQNILDAQSAKPLVLYGAIQKENLTVHPFSEWFVNNYDTYQPNETIVNSIKKLSTKDITIEIFLVTWCGDSKREVPRFYKLLNDLSFPLQQVKLIGLGGDSLVKQSPQHEEAGKGIFRVPTFIIYQNGVEINRINEFPVFSLEKDVLTILTRQQYIPNYKSFATIKNWLADGTLLDENNNVNGLAAQLRQLVTRETELNSLGRLLMEQGKKEEGLKILQINARLYPELATVSYNLGEAYHKMGDNKNAVLSLEKALELNKDPQLVKLILKLLYEAKEVKG
jgi:tetratricopeptide (TPR) repeat protein